MRNHKINPSLFQKLSYIVVAINGDFLFINYDIMLLSKKKADILLLFIY